MFIRVIFLVGFFCCSLLLFGKVRMVLGIFIISVLFIMEVVGVDKWFVVVRVSFSLVLVKLIWVFLILMIEVWVIWVIYLLIVVVIGSKLLVLVCFKLLDFKIFVLFNWFGLVLVYVLGVYSSEIIFINKIDYCI